VNIPVLIVSLPMATSIPANSAKCLRKIKDLRTKIIQWHNNYFGIVKALFMRETMYQCETNSGAFERRVGGEKDRLDNVCEYDGIEAQGFFLLLDHG
jgi:hypothetical protein